MESTGEHHKFSDAEIASALFPWGLIEFVEPRPFDHDACVEKYIRGMPPKPSDGSHPWRDTYTRELSGKRGVVTDAEARFWFDALTDPRRLEDDRNAQSTVAARRTFDPAADLEIRERFAAWVEAFTGRYRNVRFYSQAYLARLLLQLVGLEETLAILLETVDASWLSPFLDELYPAGDEDPDVLDVLTQTWLKSGTRSVATYVDQGRYQMSVENVKQRLFPLTRCVGAARAYLESAKKDPPKSVTSLYHVLNVEPDDEWFLADLAEFAPEIGRREVVLVVARLGLGGCTWLTKRVRASRREPTEGIVGALAKIRSPEVVPALLHLAEQTTTATEARQALRTFDEPYVRGLAAAATGRTKSRDLAAELLADAESKAPDAFAEAMKVLPERAQESLEQRVQSAVVERRPELPRDVWPGWMFHFEPEGRPKGLPRFCSAKSLPPLYLADGEHEVPVPVVLGLLVHIRDFDWQENDRAIGTNVRVDLDETAAKDFFWSLLEAWTQHGFPSKHAWCMESATEFIDDGLVLEFARLLDEWNVLDQRHHAYRGLALLERIGSDTALAALNKLANSSRFKGLRTRAKNALTRLATRRGLSTWQLQDLIIDDCGLEADGTAMFDYGPRQFDLAFDEEMKPVVRDEDGKIRRSLPRKRKSDDHDLVAEEKARYKTMKKRLNEALKLQKRRLETALGDMRRWDAPTWRKQYVSHPVMQHIVQRVLWVLESRDGSRITLFRVTAEREVVDVDDEEIALESGMRVALAHPLELDEAESAAWGAVFADYEIIPPFPQLDRPTYSAKARFHAYSDVPAASINPGWLRGHFNRRGWSRSRAEAGTMRWVYRDIAGTNLRVWAELHPGLDINYRRDTDQHIGTVFFTERPGGPDRDRVPLDRVPAVAYSEALWDVHSIADRAAEN